MKTFMSSILGQLKEFFAKMSRKDKTRLAILALVVIVLAVATTVILGRTKYTELYRNLNAGEAGAILGALDEMGVPSKAEGDGTILVPEEMASELRMKLSAAGYTAAAPDMTILENANGFGVTDTQSREYVRRQLEWDIARNILKSQKIQDCSVKLVIPDNSSYSFTANKIDASAAVTLTIRGGAQLTQGEAAAIAEIVMASVPGLALDNVRIVDSNWNLYDVGSGAVNVGVDINSQFALEEQAKRQLERQLTYLLAPMFGDGSFSISIGLTLNFDDVLSESIELSPPVPGELDGMAVSMMELYENSRVEGAAEGAPGTDTNGMGSDTPGYPYGELQDGELYNKVLREFNYDMNRLTTQIDKAKGTIKTLSVAIAIDDKAAAGEYSEEVRDLVAKAIGVEDGNISVQRVPFIEHEQAEDMSGASYAKLVNQREILGKIIMWGVILLLGLAVISLIKLIVKSIMVVSQPQVALAGGMGGIDYLADDDDDGEGDGDTRARFGDPDEYPEIELRGKPGNVEQLEKFIDKDPRAVAQLLRNWLSEE